jgi:predicted Rossmann-fold nucleotide-binding protein
LAIFEIYFLFIFNFMKKVVTIFGSSKPAENEEQYITAYSIGKQLALRGFDICTGGFNGIMEAASKGAVQKPLVLLLIYGEDPLINISPKKLNVTHCSKELRN